MNNIVYKLNESNNTMKYDLKSLQKIVENNNDSHNNEINALSKSNSA